MTKRTSEYPRLVMRVGQSKRLEHIAPWGEEMMQHLPYGAEVEVYVSQRRSPGRHRLYWAMVNDIVANSEDWATNEHFHAATKIELGYTQKIKTIGDSARTLLLRSAKYCLDRLNILRTPSIPGISEWLDKLATILDQLIDDGDVITLPGSIAFDKMDETEFKVFFDRAKAAWSQAGYDVAAFEREANKKLQPYYGARKNGRGQKTEPGIRDRMPENKAA